MIRFFVRFVVAGVLVLALTGLFLVNGMRRKSPVVLDAVRKVNRGVFNPRQMATAGTKDSYASIVRHTGRTSGTTYETPIGAVPTDDGFVIALPYGQRADWVQNVLASGTAEIVHHGETFGVDEPRVVATDDVARFFTAADQRAQRAFGVVDAIRLRVPEPDVAPA